MTPTQYTSTKDELVARCIPFLQELKDMTAGTAVEQFQKEKAMGQLGGGFGNPVPLQIAVRCDEDAQ